MKELGQFVGFFLYIFGLPFALISVFFGFSFEVTLGLATIVGIPTMMFLTMCVALITTKFSK